MTRRPSASSARWRARQRRDGYARKAREQGVRSRAAFKLEQINQRYKVLRKGSVVLDLGAAPGGWSVMARAAVGEQGRVVAVDLLPMQDLPEVEFIQGDLASAETQSDLKAQLAGAQVDVVISDMAPNISGIREADQARAMDLLELALEMAKQWLKPGGHFVSKVFVGSGWDLALEGLRRDFGKVHLYKPDASRPESREIYAVCLNLECR